MIEEYAQAEDDELSEAQVKEGISLVDTHQKRGEARPRDPRPEKALRGPKSEGRPQERLQSGTLLHHARAPGLKLKICGV